MVNAKEHGGREGFVSGMHVRCDEGGMVGAESEDNMHGMLTWLSACNARWISNVTSWLRA